jgi:hypothetical protein
MLESTGRVHEGHRVLADLHQGALQDLEHDVVGLPALYWLAASVNGASQ